MPLRGAPLPLRLRNFRPAAEGYLASLGGPLPYMVRLREIEAMTAAHEHALEAERRRLAEESPPGEARGGLAGDGGGAGASTRSTT